ncbi:hypothetical protein FACS18949_03150 [Clostridia bacterium]|nr:hypothetical protein FACS18949_03150 [Clostridia bacterium]
MDGRDFHPHITLGREVVTDCKPWTIEPFGETVSHIDLMLSERSEPDRQNNGKLTYTSIYRRGKWTRPIVVEPYNPLWEAAFAALNAKLRSMVEGLAVAIHHVGSTSVPGLAAKPILDVDIEIADMSVFPQIKEQLAKLGYRYEGDYGIAGREAFKYDDSEFMTHHLYVCPSDSAELRRHLTLRDYLRSHSDAVREYGELKRGIKTDRGDFNREVIMTNSEIRQLRARINKYNAWIDEIKDNAPPTLLELIDAILYQDVNRTQSQKIADLQLAARVFMQRNNISDLPALVDKVSAMRRDFNDVYDDIKKIERRMTTLDKHVEKCGLFKKHRAVSVEYNKLLAAAKAAEKETGFFAKGKADKARREAQDFYDVHDSEIIIFCAAEKYLKDVLQERYDPKQIAAQMKTWENERKNKEGDRRDRYVECRYLEADVKDAEQIKKFAVKLMFPDEPREQTREKQQQKSKSREESL